LKANGDEEEHGPALSMQQVEAAISEIARSGAPADRLRALAILRRTSSEPSVGALPEPLSTSEQISRLSRLFRAAGLDVVRRTIQQTWPNARRVIEDAVPVRVEDLPPETVAMVRERVKSVRSLYALIPELRRPGRPFGFPITKGLAERTRWCQQQALQHYADELSGAPLKPRVAEPPEVNDGIAEDNVSRVVPGPRDVGEPPGR
jgi:hypothetical protein